MGIRGIFENPRTKKAFWSTFLLPFFGGFLYARRWGAAFGMLLAVPFLVLSTGWIAAEIVNALFPSISLGCDFFGWSCGADPLTAAELRHNELVALAMLGVWGLLVIGTLIWFGVLAAEYERDRSDSD